MCGKAVTSRYGVKRYCGTVAEKESCSAKHKENYNKKRHRKTHRTKEKEASDWLFYP